MFHLHPENGSDDFLTNRIPSPLHHETCSVDGLFMPAERDDLCELVESVCGRVDQPANYPRNRLPALVDDNELDQQLELLLNETVQLPSFIDSSRVVADFPVFVKDRAHAATVNAAQYHSVQHGSSDLHLHATVRRPIPLPCDDVLSANMTDAPADCCEFDRSLHRILSEEPLAEPGTRLPVGPDHDCDFHKSRCDDISDSSVDNHKYLLFDKTTQSFRHDESLLPTYPHETSQQSNDAHEKRQLSNLPVNKPSHQEIYSYEKMSQQSPSSVRRPKPVEDDAPYVKMQNYITSLESRIQILESRLEHSDLTSKIYKQERDKYLGKVDQLNALLQTEQEKYHDLYDMYTSSVPRQDLQFKKDQTKKTINRIQSKAELKQEIKGKMIASSISNLIQGNDTERGRQRTRNGQLSQTRAPKALKTTPSEMNVAFDDTFQFPFITGSAAPSFSLPANVQKVRHLLRTSVVRPRSKSRDRMHVEREKSQPRSDVLPSLNQLRSTIHTLEREYAALNDEYDHILKRYKLSASNSDLTTERTELSGKLRILIKEMEMKMEDISRLREFHNAQQQSERATYSPGKSLSKLCALRGAQKLQQNILKTENIVYSQAFGGSL